MNWELIGLYSNAESEANRRKYKAELVLLPSVDHVGDGLGETDFKICAWRTNDAKRDLSHDDFVALCRRVAMPEPFSPRLDILPPPQRRLWDELAEVPPEFVLYGGTAVALHLGHRESVDFDFFGCNSLDPAQLVPAIPFVTGAIVTQRDPNTFSRTVDRGGPVKLSFFGVPRIARLLPPHIASDNGLQVASIPDLAGTTVSVVQMRAEAKDYIDIDALLTQGGIDLPMAIAAATAIYGTQFNPQNALKAISYFEEESLRRLPRTVKDRLARAVDEADLDRLPSFGAPYRQARYDQGPA